MLTAHRAFLRTKEEVIEACKDFDPKFANDEFFREVINELTPCFDANPILREAWKTILKEAKKRVLEKHEWSKT